MDNLQLIPGSLIGFRSWWPAARKFPNMMLLPYWSKIPWGKYSYLEPIAMAGQRWKATYTVAKCLRLQNKKRYVKRFGVHGTSVPSINCMCGLYAFYHQSTGHTLSINGVIEATGKIILHSYGFRAQRARILAIQENSFYQRSLLEHIARFYNIPLLSRQEILERYPPADLSSALPPIEVRL
jgi:hypothetical protein